jgi:hypothetical protein
MPANFPEVWLNRVRTTLTTAIIALWLDGIPELDTTVIEVGSGDASESNIIHIPTSTFKPDVLINNTTYPIALQAYNDSEVIVQLDKYQTKVTTLSDDQIIGASYPRIDNATRSHSTAILEKKFAKAIHAIAPAGNTLATPVLVTTGDVDSTGRKRLTYDDLIRFKDACDKAGMPTAGRRFVPCTDHYNDMLLDRKNFGDQLVNYKAGTLAPMIAGFEIYLPYILNPYYTVGTLAKKAFGSIPVAGTDTAASVAFSPEIIAKKTGMTKQYFAKADADPENQTNKINYRHYFIAVPMENKFIAAIASGL